MGCIFCFILNLILRHLPSPSPLSVPFLRIEKQVDTRLCDRVLGRLGDKADRALSSVGITVLCGEERSRPLIALFPKKENDVC